MMSAMRRLRTGEMPAEGRRNFNQPPLFRSLNDYHPFFCLLLMAALLVTFACLPPAASAVVCNEDQELPLGPGSGEDLQVTGPCTVNEGQTYHYRDVNIYNGGSLKFVDPAPDKPIHFWARSILVEKDSSLVAGEPSKPIGTNCQAAKVNEPSVYCGGLVTFHLYGKDESNVSFKTGMGGSGITCKTDVHCGIPDQIWNSNGDTKFNDLPGGVSDYFYAYRPLPYDAGDPNGFFGYKVLAVSYGGTVQLFGRKGATTDPETGPAPSDSGRSWVRLAKTLNPGDTTIYLDRKVDPDWEVGDQIVVTTTDYLPGHSEQLEICGVDPVNNKVTVQRPNLANPPECGKDTEAVKYIHNGVPYDLSKTKHPGIERLNLDIKVEGKDAAETRAAVALLSRSIRIVSEGNEFDQPLPGPSTEGTGKYFGGHTLVRQGVRLYQVQGVEFFQLGQGGRMGHYSLHFHETRITPPNTFVKDCSIHDSMTRWITLHATQGVTLARNVGYKSIGHGYYLEDGTEINNKLYSNIGIFARAAIKNDQNPRSVPGILAKGGQASANPPFNSDFANPTVFWLMNGWNDFQYNMAAGAGTCGACYWLLPGLISTGSRNMNWEGYASIQKLIPGGAPLMNFVGNYCSSAQLSFNTVQATDACNGLADLGPIDNPIAPFAPDPDYYPQMSGLRQPTLCTGTCSNNLGQPCKTNTDCNSGTCTANCAQTPPCGVPSPGATFDARDFCPVTVLDHYTSSFHWPEKNFAAIWLRGKWILLSNSVLSDSQNGGLGLVTGGDYTLSSVIPGNWQTAIQSVFIGNTQEDNPLASNAGPFNPLTSTDETIKGLSCDNDANRPLFCLSKGEGITMPISNFSMQQRLFNVYDGPNYQDSNAYLDITKTNLGPQCTPDSCPPMTGWMYTAALGVPIDVKSGKTRSERNCVLPNAAIGWKQPNGFYYPPAFHSTNLYFDNVDIRHLVIEPLWKPATFESDLPQVKENYCTYDPTPSTPEAGNQTFTGFTSVDRQTVLNDDDGSLTGLLSPVEPTNGETISVNLDPFFNAPVEAPECASFDLLTNDSKATGGTAKTSPYQYVTTVVYPACVVEKNCGGHCSLNNEPCARNGDCPVYAGQGQTCLDSTWGEACSDPSCYGVPLSRQLVISAHDNNSTIPMMGMGFSQRSVLTVNQGTYYIDTTVSAAKQKKGLGGPVPITSLNVFQPGASYYVFFVYANDLTKQKYQIYIGDKITDINANPDKYITPVRVDIRNDRLQFQEGVTWTGLKPTYNSKDGILTVTTDFTEFKTDFDATAVDYCQPKEYCQFAGGKCQSSLGANDPLYSVSQSICENIAGKDIDCPLFQFDGPTGKLPGCIGFKITLGNSTQFVANGEDKRPATECFRADQVWNVPWTLAVPPLAGSCFYPPLDPLKFCGLTGEPI